MTIDERIALTIGKLFMQNEVNASRIEALEKELSEAKVEVNKKVTKKPN